MDYRLILSNAATRINSMIATRDEKVKQFEANEKRLSDIDIKITSLNDAKFTISFEVEKIQKRLKTDIDNLITIAIRTVYDRDISFALVFGRGATGASSYKPTIIENGEEFDPKDEQCGGVLDIISYAMRIVLKGFEVNESRNFIAMDEPFKFLGGGLLAERAANMMKQINDELRIQSLIISHDEQCIKTADKIYHIAHNGKNSKAELISDVAGISSPDSDILRYREDKPINAPRTIKRIKRIK